MKRVVNKYALYPKKCGLGRGIIFLEKYMEIQKIDKYGKWNKIKILKTKLSKKDREYENEI